jgi:bifunctional N-acetylglucosamine-1-phosphate-uridyltransferase/glucosamine-1-phosphate-acetyltransferase GlmU-like protein
LLEPWKTLAPWNIVKDIQEIILEIIPQLNDGYVIKNNVAIHKTAVVEEHVILKGPLIVSENCFIGAHAYLRGGVFLDQQVSIGPGCEIKSSVILRNTALAHFNFAGDSILGAYVNMEAGSIIANHFNERTDKTIHILWNDDRIAIPSIKFGAMVGDHTKIGANAVLSPGSMMMPRSVVKRLSLVEPA